MKNQSISAQRIAKTKQKICAFGEGREKEKRVLLSRRRHCRPRSVFFFFSCSCSRLPSKFKLEISLLKCLLRRKTSRIRKDREKHEPEDSVCYWVLRTRTCRSIDANEYQESGLRPMDGSVGPHWAYICLFSIS